MKTAFFLGAHLNAALFFAVGATTGHAQSIFAPAVALPSAKTTTTPSPAVPAASGFGSALASDLPLVKRGPLAIRPHVEYRILYGSGIEAGPGNPRDTSIQSVAPGALFEIGQYWRLDYTPTWTFYSNEAFRDTVDQAATLTARWPHPRGMAGLAQIYQSSHAVLAETGRQTHQQSYATLVEASYKIGQHTLFETNASRNARYANAVVDAPEWTTSDWVQWSSSNWLRYEFTPRLSAGAGVSAGYSQIGVGADMHFIQPQLQVIWRPSDKLSFAAQGGREIRRFARDTRPALNSPLYTASAAYQILPTTKLSLGATRSISASYFANEVTKSRGWTAGFEQRFLRRLYLAAELTEQETGYLRTDAELGDRSDRYHALNLRLTTVLVHRLSVALLYQTGRNSSTRAAYAFRSNQYGLETSLRF